MSQVYARQAEAQAASLEVGQNNERQKSQGEESDDSESFQKPKDSYMQEGLERPNIGPTENDDEDESEEEAEEIPCKYFFN